MTSMYGDIKPGQHQRSLKLENSEKIYQIAKKDSETTFDTEAKVVKGCLTFSKDIAINLLDARSSNILKV